MTNKMNKKNMIIFSCKSQMLLPLCRASLNYLSAKYYVTGYESIK